MHRILCNRKRSQSCETEALYCQGCFTPSKKSSKGGDKKVYTNYLTSNVPVLGTTDEA